MSQPPASSKAAASSNKSASSNAAQSPSISQTQQFFSNTRAVSGASASNNQRSTASNPRNNQSAKPKHKSGKKFQVLDDDEQAAMHAIGRRGKQADITHLMNIALPPRPSQGRDYHRHSYNGPRGGKGRYNNTWGLGSGYHAVDKARYIHANYRFIVDPRGDYTAQATDADVHLDWAQVMQVIASSKSQAASCPICLGDTTAPRMAKCGHIFCLPCLIRYMHSDDDVRPPGHEKKARWKKCPICWDSVYISETRPVRWYIGQENSPPREGNDIVLRLIKRRTGNTLAMPRESADPVSKGDAVPWYHAAEVMDYARVMKGSEEYMTQQYDEYMTAVEALAQEDELMFGEDGEWTARALRFLHDAKDKVKGIGNPPAQPKKPEQLAQTKQPEAQQRPPIQFNEGQEGVPDMYALKQASNAPSAPVASDANKQPEAPASSENTTNATGNIPRTIHEMRLPPEKPQPAEYLFYQALQHYYLSPLDIRILKSAFTSYHLFPSSILPRVERVSSGHVVDDELRKRVKYLSHLPYGCEVGFLECDWTDTVPPHVLHEFKPMLDRRRRRADEKEAREEKERVRIEKAEEREIAHIKRKRPSVPAEPIWQEAEWEALPSSMASGSASAAGEGAAGASPPWPANRAGSGFASLGSPGTSPTMHRTVWGTTAIAPADDEVAGLPTDAQWAQQEDGWLQGWEKDLLDHREAEMIGEVEGLSLDEGSAASGGKKAGAGGGKKGKKGKKITLMSTTGRRGA
ncbi:hypothetical protein KC353_g10673 [Hortaea werneckii]|uniref:RING-type domain-containing protein n=1 Tax=Hortaea werneckii TaxID=91943 RepID=A0A3M7BW76_HORWE|nr:hypothetical protein KC353_g10673 [Hortaea werneckii]RMY44112.1 hypothetical protein D0865_10772 [Hortaea werneckii]